MNEEIPEEERIWLLTDREFEIAWYKAIDKSKYQIKEKLGISINTVDTHITNIYKADKLDIKAQGNYQREEEFLSRYQNIILAIIQRKEELTKEDISLFARKKSEFEEKRRNEQRRQEEERRRKEAEKQKEEEQKRLEEERLKREQEEKIRQEKEEERRRKEAEKQKEEEQKRLEEERLKREQEEKIRQQVEELGRRRVVPEILERPPRPRILRRNLITISILILCLACTGVIFMLVSFRPWIENVIAQIQEIQPPAAAENQRPPVAQEVPSESTISAAVEITDPSEIVFVPETETIIPTSTRTLLPTDTPRPTNTPSPTRTPTPNLVLFVDGFQQGLKPDWQLITGSPEIVNGELTSSEGVWLIVGDPEWSNYFVEFNVNPADCWLPRGINAVGIYAQDEENMIAYVFSDCESKLYLVENGEWNEIPNSKAGGVGYEYEKIKFRAENGTFTAYVNDQKKVDYFSTNLTQGKVLLRLDGKTRVKDVTVKLNP